VNYAIDSNILARSIENNHPMQEPAREAIDILLTGGASLFVLAQNLYEFWVIVTRPVESNGLGLSPADAQSHLERFERLFSVKFDVPAIYSEWRRLVINAGVRERWRTTLASPPP
jgi:predicted nucleic acid-binding protein